MRKEQQAPSLPLRIHAKHPCLEIPYKRRKNTSHSQEKCSLWFISLLSPLHSNEQEEQEEAKQEGGRGSEESGNGN